MGDSTDFLSNRKIDNSVPLGFPQKKTQKTSKADLDLAAKRYRDLVKELKL
jgi:phage-related protein